MVWRHEAYREHERAILARLAGVPETVLSKDLPEADYPVSLSRDAVRALFTAWPNAEFESLRDGPQDLAEAVAQALPVSRSNPTVNLWTPEQTEAQRALRERLRRHRRDGTISSFCALAQ